MKMFKTILITDAGGRGAVLVDKYAQSKLVGKILAVPGNDLMKINSNKQVVTFPNLKTTSVKEILDICKKEKVDLVDVSQDNAVEVGLVNELNKIGVKVFGPTKLAGQIEWDKAWAREFMKKYDIPIPEFFIFKSQNMAIDFVKQNQKKKWFIKASGLAEGKGVIPGNNLTDTISAIKEMSRFARSGETFILEEALVGEEFSAFAICDGEDLVYIGSAVDHKRVNDGDSGPNTGGMGCVSNPLIVDKDIKNQVLNIMQITINGLKKEGREYKGILYLGGMVVNGKVFVIEFNARWGDPEAEVIIPSIRNDYLEIVSAVISGELRNLKIEVDEKIRIAVAVVAKGYPGDYSKVKGKEIYGIDRVFKSGIKIYGAGVKKVDNKFVVNGGRVLYLMAEGDNVLQAREKVYSAVRLIGIEGGNLHYRSDIGWRDINRIKNLKL